jgi:hypothetical protein
MRQSLLASDSRRSLFFVAFAAAAMLSLVFVVGCCHPKVTAVALSPWNRGEPEGIPFYLPKPLLIVAKNFRYLEEAKVGLTDSAPIPNHFDDQAAYGDLEGNFAFSASGGATPPKKEGGRWSDLVRGDGEQCGAAASKPYLYSSHVSKAHGNGQAGPPVTPGTEVVTTFYTYHIVFIPDLTQKYGLKIRGGVGEIRAAMNLVNGWQFTGLGPFYMKDSSTAQNLMAGGIAANLALSGASDLVQSLVNLQSKARDGQANPALVYETQRKYTEFATAYGAAPRCIPDYAEIYVYEPHVTPDGRMEWSLLTNLTFSKDDAVARVTEERTIGIQVNGAPVVPFGNGCPVAPPPAIFPSEVPLMPPPESVPVPKPSEAPVPPNSNRNGAARTPAHPESPRVLAAHALGVPLEGIQWSPNGTAGTATPASVPPVIPFHPTATRTSFPTVSPPAAVSGVSTTVTGAVPAVVPPTIVAGDVTHMTVNQPSLEGLRTRRGLLARWWDRIKGNQPVISTSVSNVQTP